MNTVYLGLDAGSSQCHLIGLNHQGTIIYELQFSTSEKKLIKAFNAFDGEGKLHLEASELSNWIAEIALDHLQEVIIGDPKRNAWIANDPLKSDHVDAYKLAELIRMGRVSPVHRGENKSRRNFKVDLSRALDSEIWEYAREYGFMIVTKDSDFHQRVFLKGPLQKSYGFSWETITRQR